MQLLLTPAQLNTFIQTGCLYDSSNDAKLFTTGGWESVEFQQDYLIEANSALNSCEIIWNKNNEFMKSHYQNVQNWFCETEILNCTELEFELDPFGETE